MLHQHRCGAMRFRQTHGTFAKDKFIVEELSSREKIWWGKVNQPMDENDYLQLRQAVLSYLQGRELFVMDGFAGADPRYTVPIRVVSEFAWHSLFARQLFRRATPEQLETHIPEWTVINACKFQVEPKNKHRLNSEALRNRRLRAQNGVDRRYAVRGRNQKERLHRAELLTSTERRAANALLGQHQQARGRCRVVLRSSGSRQHDAVGRPKPPTHRRRRTWLE